MNLSKKLLLSYLLVAIIPIFFVGLLSYTNFKSYLLLIQQNSFEIIADIRLEEVNNFFNHFKREIITTKEESSVRTFVSADFHKTHTLDSLEHKKLTETIDGQTQALIKELGVDSVLIVNLKGVVTHDSTGVYINQSIDKIFPFFGAQAFEHGKTEVFSTDLYKHDSDNNGDFLVSAPIYDLDNVLAGVIVFEINAQNLYKIIGNSNGFGKTGETLIARRVSIDANSAFLSYPYDENGDHLVYISPGRFNTNLAFQRIIRIGDSVGLPMQQAIQDANGNGISVDYEGKKVFSIWHFLPEYNWGLVSEISVDELLLPLQNMLKAILFFGVVTFVLVVLISIILSKMITAPIKELTHIVDNLANADFTTVTSATNLNDEVGQLARAFNGMAIKLRDLYKNLDKKVREKTAKVEESEQILKQSLDESERINRLMVGRELKMIELKKEIETLKSEKK